MTAAEKTAAAVLGNGKAKNVKAKSQAKKTTTPKPKVDPILDLRDRAQRWADYHANPKTRDKMDELLVGLTTDDQCRVVLDGQRLAAGMPMKYLTTKGGE